MKKMDMNVLLNSIPLKEDRDPDYLILQEILNLKEMLYVKL